ncbi:hypothetical protein ACEA81_24420, partial [Escherichia coli]
MSQPRRISPLIRTFPREEGAVAVATAIEAGDERRARAKFHWQFLEHYPAAQ